MNPIFDNIFIDIFFSVWSIIFRPETKEGKEAETEKKAEQENTEPEKIEKELEKDKVWVYILTNIYKWLLSMFLRALSCMFDEKNVNSSFWQTNRHLISWSSWDTISSFRIDKIQSHLLHWQPFFISLSFLRYLINSQKRMSFCPYQTLII